MKIAITGASGFLGKRLIERLILEDDVKLVAFSSKPKSILEISECIESYSRNEIFDGKLNGVDVLVNCAFPRNNDGQELAIGLKFISDVLKEATKSNVSSVVNISSQSVYSQKRCKAASETTNICLESLYAVGKYATEIFTSNICKDINYTNIRLASLIGPSFDQRLVNKMIRMALVTNEITIAEGNQKFGFMDVDDAVEGIMKVIKCYKNPYCDVYNLGLNVSYTLGDIASSIVTVLGMHGYNIKVNKKLSSDIINSSLICDKFYSDFNYNPSNTLEMTIEKIYQKIVLEG